MKYLFSILITLTLFAAAVYFFYARNFVAAVIFLVWALSRAFGYSIERLLKTFSEVAKHSQIEKNCNVSLDINFNIEEALKHSAVGDLFERLKKEKKFKEKSKEDWIKKMLQSYKKKFGKKEALEELKFNIKNNIVWKNGQVDFVDSLYHEIYIPYDYKDGDDGEGSSFNQIYIGLKIRLLVVNGILKLQIGKFAKEVSPEVTKKGLDIYKTYETLTSFPLMYFHWQHKIPESYLNLSAYATDSWYRSQKGEKVDMRKDWKEVCRDIRDYNYLLNIADESSGDDARIQSITKRFEQKKKKMLADNNFKDPFARKEGEDDFDYFDLQDSSIYFISNLMSVFVANQGDYKERRGQYLYTDYYEERP